MELRGNPTFYSIYLVVLINHFCILFFSSIGSIRTPHSGIANTPVRMRPDIRVDRRVRQVNVGPDQVSVDYKIGKFLYELINLNRSWKRSLKLHPKWTLSRSMLDLSWSFGAPMLS